MTTRLFRFTGSVEPSSTGVITLNGVEVWNGAFTGTEANNSVTATGDIDLNDASAVGNVINVPTTVTVTSGALHVSLTKWNFGLVPNPVFSPEQFATLTTPGVLRSTAVAIYEAVAVPPLTSEDVTMLMGNDPVDNEVREEIKIEHNITLYVTDPYEFVTGVTPAMAACNRSNVLLDGVEPPGANTSVGIYVVEGSTLTYDSLVWVSNWYTG